MIALRALDCLEKAHPLVPETLIGPDDWERVCRIAELLPAPPTVGFEIKLGDEGASADFGVAYQASPESRALAETRFLAGLPRELQAHPTWRRVQACSLALNQSQRSDGARVRDLWLEFDVDHRWPGTLVPALFYTLPARSSATWVSHELCELLLGTRLPHAVQSHLDGLLRRLPAEASPYQIGIMHSRGDTRIRLYVNLPPSLPLDGFLSDVGWPGSPDAVAERVAELSPFVRHYGVGIDVGERIGPRLGLECYPSLTHQPALSDAWAGFLDRLVTVGLCLPAKRDGLKAWPGYTVESLWWQRIFSRQLWAVKLVVDDAKPIEAKAYFGFVQGWVGPHVSRPTHPRCK